MRWGCICIVPLNASTEADIDAAFASLVEQRAGGTLVITAATAPCSWLPASERDRIALAARTPAMPA